MSLSLVNSTNVPLLDGDSFIGSSYDNILDFVQITISIKCDTGYNLTYIYSQNKVDIDYQTTQTITAQSDTQFYNVVVKDRYFKLQIDATDGDMSVLNVQTIYKTSTTYSVSSGPGSNVNIIGPIDNITKYVQVTVPDGITVSGSVSVSGSVNVDNFPTTQAVSGAVDVNNFPTTQAVSGSVNVDNFPTTQAVSGAVDVNNFPTTQAVSGSVNVDNFPTTQAVSGAVDVNNFPTTQAVSGSVNVDNFPTTQAISGAVDVNNFPTTQAISGAVDVNNFPTTQAVSGSVNVDNFPTTQAVSGAVDVNNFPTTQAVSGSVDVGNFPATQAVSGSVDVGNFPATQAVSNTDITTIANALSNQRITSTVWNNVSVVQNGQSNVISPGTSTYCNTTLSCYGTSSQNAIIAVQFSNNGTTFYTTQYQYTLTAGNFGFSIPCSAYHIRLILLSAVTSTITAYIDIC